MRRAGAVCDRATRTIRLGTPGTQVKAFLAGVNGVTISGPTRPVVVNASGQLGTATTAAASVSDPAAVSALAAEVKQQADMLKRQQRQIEALQRELRVH